MTGPGDTPMRYRPRYGSPDSPEERGDAGSSPSAPADRRCSVCQVGRVSARARYCSTACKQHAYRLRHPSLAPPALDAVTADLRRRQALVAHTVYECPSCETRYLAARRCPDCHLFCRRLGLGGPCPHCDDLVLVTEILSREVTL
jgi:hypothetical protein